MDTGSITFKVLGVFLYPLALILTLPKACMTAIWTCKILTWYNQKTLQKQKKIAKMFQSVHKENRQKSNNIRDSVTRFLPPPPPFFKGAQTECLSKEIRGRNSYYTVTVTDPPINVFLAKLNCLGFKLTRLSISEFCGDTVFVSKVQKFYSMGSLKPQCKKFRVW